MSWSDRQVPATLDGIPLLITSLSVQVGRRVQSLSFPGRDEHGHEDQGREPRRYRVEAVTVGEDYDLAVLDLVAALESPGPHAFVHPSLGEGRDGRPLRWVLDGAASIDETPGSTVGDARVSFSIVETTEDADLEVSTSTPAALASAAAYAVAAGGRYFVARWNVDEGGSDWTRALAALGSAMTAARVAAGRVTAVLGVANTVARQISEVERLASSLAAAPSLLASTVGAIWGSLSSLVVIRDRDVDEEETTLAAGTRASALVREVVAAASWVAADELGEASSEEAAANDRALGVLQATAALAAAATALATITIDTSDTAIKALDDLAAAIASVAAQDEDPEIPVYLALVDLRAALDAHLRGVALLLPSVTTYTLPESTPAILLAWRLLGDAQADAEIVARNPGMPDPGALPGGEEVVILA